MESQLKYEDDGLALPKQVIKPLLRRFRNSHEKAIENSKPMSFKFQSFEISVIGWIFCNTPKAFIGDFLGLETEIRDMYTQVLNVQKTGVKPKLLPSHEQA